jgi:hypothetical protein
MMHYFKDQSYQSRYELVRIWLAVTRESAQRSELAAGKLSDQPAAVSDALVRLLAYQPDEKWEVDFVGTSDEFMHPGGPPMNTAVFLLRQVLSLCVSEDYKRRPDWLFGGLEPLTCPLAPRTGWRSPPTGVPGAYLAWANQLFLKL